MKHWDVLVEVSPRSEIADPAGTTVERALRALGFSGVSGVRVGKAIRLEVAASDEADARAVTKEMCERLLANPVIEDARIELRAVVADDSGS